eukprot:301713_1
MASLVSGTERASHIVPVDTEEAGATAEERTESKVIAQSRTIKILVIVVIVLAVTCIALAIVSATASNGNDGATGSTDTDKNVLPTITSTSSPSTTTTLSPSTSTTQEPAIEYCTIPECLKVASDIASSLNPSVDPCNDFYHYVCDGWTDEQSWRYIDSSSLSALGTTIPEHNRNVFLDALFYDTNDELTQYESVQKATQYFKTCHDATLDAYEAEQYSTQVFMSNIMAATTFVQDAETKINDPSAVVWDVDTINGFQDAMKSLNKIDTNPLFDLEAQSTKLVSYMEMDDIWFILYDPETLDLYIQYLFLPRYMALYNVNSTYATVVGTLVRDFTLALMAITTPDHEYSVDVYSTLTEYPLSDVPTELGTSTVMDYTQFVYDLFDVPTGHAPEQIAFMYLTDQQSFFQKLGPLLEATSPLVVQLYVQFAVSWYYRLFVDVSTQERSMDRTTFCYERTIEKFSYVYGYILFNEAYDEETFQFATNMAQGVKLYGVRSLIDNANWLDSDSKAEALKKVDGMEVYIGSPPPLMNGIEIDQFYAKLPDLSDDWMSNFQLMDMQYFTVENDTFWGNAYDLTGDWPMVFAEPAMFDGWLIGVNAFYLPTALMGMRGNWFTIPITISQSPMFVATAGYPSALSYGALGWVTGHEMMHGFDPSGTGYNWNGTYVGSIYSNRSLADYENKMECFKKQYSGIAVDSWNGTLLYVDGNVTITENVADNAGLSASWTAWRDYLSKNGDDKPLYGVDMTQEQLFFVAGARVWCESHPEGAYKDHDDVHAPLSARIIGTFQNMDEFADAFSCDEGTRMNPKDKCSVF